MILETTNPKYKTRPQIPAGRKVYVQMQDRADLEFISEGSRSMARGELQTEQFADRPPAPFVRDPASGRHRQLPLQGNTIRNLEPEPKTRGSSLQLFDEAHDAPVWLIIDVVTGAVFARVRGSLAWVVAQVRLAAHQLGGQEKDLYFRREA